MGIVFGILAMVAAALLILIVVVQNSKGGGLSSALGASNITNMIGTRRATQDIEKYTWYLLAGVLILAFMANVTLTGNTSVKSSSNLESLMNAPSSAAPATDLNSGGGATEAPADAE
ncbi:MAG: preprotein translocase subunit SecG [Bacteroidia bacterium]